MVKAGKCIFLIPTPHSGLGHLPDRVIRRIHLGEGMMPELG